MKLTWKGEYAIQGLEDAERRGYDPFAVRDNWTLRELSHRQPIGEGHFHDEVLKYTTVSASVLRASVTRLLKKGYVEL